MSAATEALLAFRHGDTKHLTQDHARELYDGIERLQSVERDLIGQCATLRAALSAVAGFGDVNLAGEWEHALRDIIRSMTDCAKNALNQQSTCPQPGDCAWQTAKSGKRCVCHPTENNT